jgi:CRISPR-associated protein Cas5d
MREFAADFEWEPDPDAALARRAAELSQPATIDEDLGLMLYDVFDHQSRAQGFRWLTADEEVQQAATFEQSLVGQKKGEQTKRRKDFAANRLRSTTPPIKPQPVFFHARLSQSRLDCHPDRVFTASPGGN